jgi:hypothetical protein
MTSFRIVCCTSAKKTNKSEALLRVKLEEIFAVLSIVHFLEITVIFKSIYFVLFGLFNQVVKFDTENSK